MTSGAGIEYINVKKASYTAMQRENASYSAAPSVGVRRVPAARPVRSGYGIGDLVGELLKKLGASALTGWHALWRELFALRGLTTVRTKERKPLPVAAVAYILIFSAVASFLVLGNTRLNEASLAASELKTQIAAEEKRADELQSTLRMRYDAVEVENYATNVRGFVKSGDVAKSYVSVVGEDKIVVSASNEIG